MEWKQLVLEYRFLLIFLNYSFICEMDILINFEITLLISFAQFTKFYIYIFIYNIYFWIFVHFQLAWKPSFLCFPNLTHFSNSFYLPSAKSFTFFHLQVLTYYQTGNSFFPYFGWSNMLKKVFLTPLLVHSYGRVDGNVILDNLKEDPSSRGSRAIPAEGPDKSIIE